MRTSHVILPIMALAILFACGYDDHDIPAVGGTEPLPANIPIGKLRDSYAGEAAMVYDDLIISGYVSANDRSGNFYRTFMVQDATGAIEVRAGLYDLHSVFPIGRYVAIRAKGLGIGAYNGVLQIGLPPTSDGGYQTDYFGYMPVMERYVFPADLYSVPEAMSCSIGSLDEKLCGGLVEVTDIVYLSDEENPASAWGEPSDDGNASLQTGYRIFEDALGERICVMTSGYADFAEEAVPRGKVTLRGILMHGKTGTGKTMFILKLRDTDDIFY